MNRTTKSVIVGGIICLVAASVFLYARRTPKQSFNKMPPHSYPPGAESLLIETAKVLDSYEESEVPAILDDFRKACQDSCRELIGEAKLGDAQADSFTEAAVERLGMYLAPDYDNYYAYCKRLAGKEPKDAFTTNIFPNRTGFEAGTVALRLMPLDPKAVHVRALYLRGHTTQNEVTADDTFLVDYAGYFSDTMMNGLGGPKKPGSTIYEVILPVDVPLPDEDPSTGKRVRLVLGMAFVFDPVKSRWLPWRVGFHDPSSEGHTMYAPWL